MNPVGNEGASREGRLGWADALTCAALDQIAFTPDHRTLFVGAVPTQLVGIAALHGHVDVVDPGHERTRLLQHAVPGARIIRSFLADAVPRLHDEYDVVISVDPTDVAGPWTSAETFNTIARIAEPATHGLCLITLDPFGGHDAAGGVDAPLTMAELEDVLGGSFAMRALEPLDSTGGPSVLAYDPQDAEASAWAATTLAQPTDGAAYPLAQARRVHARLSLGPMGGLATAALVGKTAARLPRALVIGQDTLTPLTSGPSPAEGVDIEPGAVPLTSALTMALTRGQIDEARHLVHQYAELVGADGSVPALAWCVRTGESDTVITLSPHPTATGARTAVESFCEDLIRHRCGASVLARYSNATDLADELLRRETVGATR